MEGSGNPQSFKLHPAQKRLYEGGRVTFEIFGLRSRVGRGAAIRAAVLATAPTEDDRKLLSADLKKYGWAMQGPNGEHIPVPTRNGSPPIVFFGS